VPLPSVRELEERIYLVERPLEEGEPGVAAVLIVGEERAALVDTLTCPADMAPVRDLLAGHGRSLVVVNTHADWDHCWGNAAFPDAPIVGHRLCRQRLLGSRERDELRRRQASEPNWFAEVQLVPPFITFDTTLQIELGALTLALYHVPGHTTDCLLAHVPQRRLLLAGDCAEAPWPLVGDVASVAEWARELRRWAASDVHTVVPAHGPVAGPEFLADNAGYLEALLAGQTDPPRAGVPPFYRQAHDENVGALQGEHRP
jgi:glyoxylase-like metal-dependent hydrolase (beta-lactamase superfamily II)